MAKSADVTRLLPPPTAVRLAWALTGSFVKDNTESKDIASESKKLLDDIIERARENDKEEKGKKGEENVETGYVQNAATDIEATMRTLDTIYKGRELNLQENDKLRAVNLDNIKEDVQFGRNAKDFMKSLPAMAITSGTGTITLNKLLENHNLPDWTPWIIGLVFAGIGFGINAWITRQSAVRKQKLYINQDYERSMYYQQYITRVRTALINLYTDIDRLHNRFFKKKYPLDESETATTVVENMLRGAMPTLCVHIHKHIREGIVTPDTWTLCEAGGEAARECKFYEK